MSRIEVRLALAVALTSPGIAVATPDVLSPVGIGDLTAGVNTVSLAAGPMGRPGLFAGQLLSPTAGDFRGAFEQPVARSGGMAATKAPLTDQSGATPVLASASDGTAIVAWRQTDGVYARRIGADGTLGAATRLIPIDPGAIVRSVRTAAAGPHDGVVVAVIDAGDTTHSLIAVSLTNDRWGEPHLLRGGRQIVVSAARGNDTRGVAVAWSEVSSSGAKRVVLVGGRAGKWRQPEIIGVGGARWVGVGVGDGAPPLTTVAWISSSPSRNLMSRTRLRSGELLPAVRHARGVPMADLDADANGRAVLVWPYRSATRSGVSVRSGAGRWGVPIVRTRLTPRPRILDVAADVNARGEASAIWHVQWGPVTNAVGISTHEFGVGAVRLSPTRAVTSGTIVWGYDSSTYARGRLIDIALAADGTRFTTFPFWASASTEAPAGNWFAQYAAVAVSAHPPAVTHLALHTTAVPGTSKLRLSASFSVARTAPMIVSVSGSGASTPTLVRAIVAHAGTTSVDLGTYAQRGQLLTVTVGARPLVHADDQGSAERHVAMPLRSPSSVGNGATHPTPASG